MSKNSSSTISKELAALPIARIETMDESYVLPLREYLFANGCQVFVNSGPTENVTYFFIVGDSDFVKKTLAFRHQLGKKQLVICWDTEQHESIHQFLTGHTKIVYVDPVMMSPLVLKDVFAFFFTAKGKELVLQTQRSRSVWDTEELSEYEPTHELDATHTAVSEPDPDFSSVREDMRKKRLTGIFADVFGKQQTEQRGDRSIGRKNGSMIANNILFLLFLLSVVCILPFLLYISSIMMRAWCLGRGASALSYGKGNEVRGMIERERQWGVYTKASQPIALTYISWVSDANTMKAYENTDRLLSIVSEIESDILGVNVSNLSLNTFLPIQQNAGEPSSVVAVDVIKKELPSIRGKLDLAQVYIQTLRAASGIPFSLRMVRSMLERGSDKLERIRHSAETAERFSQLYPFIGGFKNSQNILVLFQNSSELRPTGGFIGSLARITVSDGAVTDIAIEDVYTLDGQLKGHVDPPDPIKELLSQEHWYLRDSNWNPDFPTSASHIRFFYQKETGQQADAVIAITSSFVVRLLKAVGPIDLSAYNDRITADNFYLKSFSYTQNNFFPGSSQKKDFLGALMESIVEKLRSHPGAGLALGEMISESLEAGDIQIFSAHPDGQMAIEQFGWAGKTPAASSCPQRETDIPCRLLYLSANEANMGVNKVNSFIQRNQSRSVVIGNDGMVGETITRKIQNTSQGESLGGAYTAYLRFFLPEGALVSSLTIDGKPVPMKEKGKLLPLPYGELDNSVMGTVGVALAFAVDPGRERVLSLTMTHPAPLFSDAKEAELTLFEQKQPGVDAVPTITTIVYPPNWDIRPVPKGTNSSVVAKPGLITYNTDLSTNSEQSFRILR